MVRRVGRSLVLNAHGGPLRREALPEDCGAVRWGGEHRLGAAAQPQPWSLSEAPPEPPVLTAYMAVQVSQDFPVDDK